MIKNRMILSPAQIILCSFILTIILGTAALALPWSRHAPIPLLDLLFTATSATCVTGLFTVSLEQFTTLGHFILMVLIQIGGLGLITLTLFFVYLLADIKLGTQLFAGEVLDLETWKNAKKLTLFILKTTLLTEGLATIWIFFSTPTTFSIWYRLFLSLFHATSAFCNSGIMLPSMPPLQYSYSLMIVTMVLMSVGGIGFTTLREVIKHIKARLNHVWHHLSLNTTVILYGSGTSLLASTMLIGILEHHNVFNILSMIKTLFFSVFHAISFRSAGFLLVPVSQLQLATLFLMLLISFVGSAPGSTGSGIKITTFAVLIATIRTAINGRLNVEMCGRQIPLDLMYKAIAIISMSVGWIIITLFCLLITEPEWHFLDLMIETVSAFTTLGVSTKASALLSPIGKLFIILSMMIGRIGSYTIILALKLKKRKDSVGFSYPEERIMLG